MMTAQAVDALESIPSAFQVDHNPTQPHHKQCLSAQVHSSEVQQVQTKPQPSKSWRHACSKQLCNLWLKAGLLDSLIICQ